MADVRVDLFPSDECLAATGRYATSADLERRYRVVGLPLNEVDGLASVQPVSTPEAGPSLRHGEP